MYTNRTRRAMEAKGFSLLEITMAMAVFAVTIGISAQGLIAYYALMDMQNQRVVAMNQCRATLSQMRNARTTSLDTILAQYPNGQSVAGPTQLRSSTIAIAYEDVTANPLVPTVTVTWEDIRGRTLHVSLSTALTDQ